MQSSVRWLGLLALFSGVALLVHILAGSSLPLALGITGTGSAVMLAFAWQRLTPARRRQFADHLKVGLMAGVVATAVYDAAKYGLSLVDGSGFNPFGAIRIFGALLVGQAAPSGLIFGAGIGFHLFNGILFGVAFSVMFGTKGVWAGILWGLFLETFQLTLYPGWLDISAYREFATISALGHVAYGATLGGLSRFALARRGYS